MVNTRSYRYLTKQLKKPDCFYDRLMMGYSLNEKRSWIIAEPVHELHNAYRLAQQEGDEYVKSLIETTVQQEIRDICNGNVTRSSLGTLLNEERQNCRISIWSL